jgi:hypothetical protein
MTNSIKPRGKSLDSRIARAWDVSTSQLTLAVRRRCAGVEAQPRQARGAAPANVAASAPWWKRDSRNPRGAVAGQNKTIPTALIIN